MKVYALMSNYSYGCEFWEATVDLYMNFDDALMELIVLEQDNPDPCQSWSVREMSVK